MTFAAPQLLWGLLLLPLAVGVYLLLQRRRRRYAVRFTNLDLLANLATAAPRWRRHVPPALALLALAALLVAVARPQVDREVSKGGTLLLALDTSGSMEATDVSPSRLAAAKAAAAGFVERLPDGAEVGLVSFSTGAELVVPPTDDHDDVARALDGLSAGGGTAMGDAIALAANVGTDQAQTAAAREDDADERGVTLVLLSDGSPSPGTLDPQEAAQRARAAGVQVSTIALGTDEGTVTQQDAFGSSQSIEVPPDRETLRAVAETTGGLAFDAPSEEALDGVYERLRETVATELERQEVTAWAAGLGAALLALGAGLSALWFGRVP